MIPKIVWQTYKDDFNSISFQAQKCSMSWRKLNPDYKHKYFSDKDAENIIKEHYGDEWLEIFKNVPVGVIRGDIFRYLMIYKFGGVYSDIDTLCLVPIREWIDGPIDNKDEYNAIFSVELLKGDSQKIDRLCQWTFAAAPGMEIMGKVVDNVKNALTTIDWSKVDDVNIAVHNTSGPDIFSYSILEAMGFATKTPTGFNIDPSIDLLNNVDLVNNSKYCKDNKIFIYGNKRSGLFNNRAVRHLYAGSSDKWNDGVYVQWKKQTIE